MLSILLVMFLPASLAAANTTYPFNDATLPTEERVRDLLARLTLHEKIGMMFMSSSMAFGNDHLPKGGVDEPSTAVPRLGVPEFDFMGQGNVYRGASNGCLVNCCSCYDGHNTSKCCHDGFATQFPQGTGVAATWNISAAFEMGQIAADESRGMMHFPGKAVAADYRTGASSVINILKDGRWGRAPETYGECPVLTGAIAVAFNKGLMGYLKIEDTEREHGDRIKVLGSVRHFVAYAGPDSQRFHFDAQVSDDDLDLTYLPAWRALVEARALGGVMSAISALNGIPSVAHRELLTGRLRDDWGFDGFVISDCDTLPAVASSMHYTAGLQQSVTASVKAGNDLNCGPEFADLVNATRSGFIAEADLDVSVSRLLARRVQVGDLDLPRSADPYSAVPYSVVDAPAHRAFARRLVAEGAVLLHNGKAASGQGRVLPLARGVDRAAAKTFLVVGPTADDETVQAHTYHGTPARWITVLDGLQEVGGAGARFRFVRGCERTGAAANITAAVEAAEAMAVDSVVFVGGLQASMEEEGTDRVDSIALPGRQLELLKALHAVGKPLVAITISGGPLAEEFLATAANVAWVWSSYFGQDGRGLADVLFGDTPFSGRLPFTVMQNAAAYGGISEYAMTAPPFGKTYRYLLSSSANASAAPLYPFGYGLSLADMSLAGGLSLATPSFVQQQPYCPVGASCVTPANDTVEATVVVRNNMLRDSSLPIDGARVVALFGRFLDRDGAASVVPSLPTRQLLAHTKVGIPAGGAAATVKLVVRVSRVAGALRQAWPGLLQMWVGHGLGPGDDYVGSPGEAPPPLSANVTLVLPMPL